MMTTDEVIDLLTLIAGCDNRRVGDATIVIWTEVAREAGWTLPTARRAVVEHVAYESDAYLQPGHITQRIAAERRRVARGCPLFTPPAHLADDPATEIRWVREQRRRWIDGAMQAWAAGHPLRVHDIADPENPKRGEIPADPRFTALRKFAERAAIAPVDDEEPAE